MKRKISKYCIKIVFADKTIRASLRFVLIIFKYLPSLGWTYLIFKVQSFERLWKEEGGKKRKQTMKDYSSPSHKTINHTQYTYIQILYIQKTTRLMNLKYSDHLILPPNPNLSFPPNKIYFLKNSNSKAFVKWCCSTNHFRLSHKTLHHLHLYHNHTHKIKSITRKPEPRTKAESKQQPPQLKISTEK